MKKFIPLVAIITLCLFNANARVVLDINKITAANITAETHTDADFSGNQNVYENWTGVSQISMEGYVLNCAQGEGTTSVGVYTAKEGKDWTLRFYKSNTMEVVAPEGVSMSKIEFKFDGASYGSPFTPSTGNAALDGATLTWTGNANAVTFTNTGGKNARIVTIIIYEEKEDNTFNPNNHSSEGASGEGTFDDPFNIIRAYDYCNATGETITPEHYYVNGYVIDGSIDLNYGNATFSLCDNSRGEGIKLTTFRMSDINNSKFTNAEKISKGDFIVVYGQLVNFNGESPEIYDGTLVSINREYIPEKFSLVNKDGVTIYYEKTSDNTCKVTYNYKDNIPCYSGSIFIPETVNYHDRKFSITSIGKKAFYNCINLEYVSIPSSVTYIGEDAFYKCANLREIKIPNSVLSTGMNVFRDCYELKSVTLSESMSEISFGAFAGCNKLYKIKFPNSISKICDWAFSRSSLVSLNISNSITWIGMNAFDLCNTMAYLTISNSVKFIDGEAFHNCANLKYIYVNNNNPTNIILGYNVFSGVQKSCILFVPQGSKELYDVADQWKDFLNIEEFEYSGIEEIVASEEDDNLPYYNLNGVMVENPAPGIYIRGGKKVVIK